MKASFGSNPQRGSAKECRRGVDRCRRERRAYGCRSRRAPMNAERAGAGVTARDVRDERFSEVE